MSKKLNNLREAQYYGNFNLVGEHIVKSRKAKPNSEPLNDMYFAWQEVGFYVHNLIVEERLYEQSLSQYRSDKIRAVERARIAEEKIKQLEEEIERILIQSQL